MSKTLTFPPVGYGQRMPLAQSLIDASEDWAWRVLTKRLLSSRRDDSSVRHFDWHGTRTIRNIDYLVRDSGGWLLKTRGSS